MTKKLLLKLDDDIHTSLKEYQIKRVTQDSKITNLNKLLNELIKKGTSFELGDKVTDILERAKNKDKS
jgi:hypothetical protein